MAHELSSETLNRFREGLNDFVSAIALMSTSEEKIWISSMMDNFGDGIRSLHLDNWYADQVFEHLGLTPTVEDFSAVHNKVCATYRGVELFYLVEKNPDKAE